MKCSQCQKDTNKGKNSVYENLHQLTITMNEFNPVVQRSVVTHASIYCSLECLGEAVQQLVEKENHE